MIILQDKTDTLIKYIGKCNCGCIFISIDKEAEEKEKIIKMNTIPYEFKFSTYYSNCPRCNNEVFLQTLIEIFEER